tara:strand:- start:445 stop:1305 length:861 start_codon:yes stop_codon:yes gene_type:complete
MYFLKKIKKLFSRKKSIFFVNSFENQENFLKKLQNQKIIGIDTEFDWRNTYFPILSLIQISTVSDIFLVDSMDFKNEKFLKKILEDKSILKIFHSARSDSTVLSNCKNIQINNIYDIQQAEKFITKGEITSYAKLVEKYLSIKIDKSETNSNWLKRPLSEKQLKYAAEDVEYLMDIYFEQISFLSSNDLNEILKNSKREAFLGNQNLGIARLNKRKKNLSKKGQEIFLWREEIAQRENIPPNFIFDEKNIKFLLKLSGLKNNDLRKKIVRVFSDSKILEEFLTKFN